MYMKSDIWMSFSGSSTSTNRCGQTYAKNLVVFTKTRELLLYVSKFSSLPILKSTTYHRGSLMSILFTF